jgi:hypothetical protein
MKRLLVFVLVLAAATACNPAREYYKASGQRDQDESKYIGAFVVCSIFLQEEGTRQKEECLASGGILYKCGEIESTVLLMIPFCAETLADVPPGEFNDLDFGGM